VNKAHLAIDTHVYQMQKSMSQVHMLTWDFAIRSVVSDVKKSLLADESVHEAVKQYLTAGAVTQLHFYFKNRIDTDATLYSCAEGRACLKEYGQLRLDAQEVLRQAGITAFEINLYEIIAYLTHEGYRIDMQQSVESILVKNREQQYLQLLAMLCHKYGHKSGVVLLTEVEQCMAVYQVHDDARKEILNEQHRLLTKKKSLWSKLVERVV